MSEETGSEQLEIAGVPRPRKKKARTEELAASLPVARVVVDAPATHLDRLFDYAVPQSMDSAVQPGVRVKVRFAGRDCDGFVAERVAESDHAGKLQQIRRVVSSVVVLTPQIHRLARTVADYYAGTLWDVLRLAIPARHAGAEERDVLPAHGGELALAKSLDVSGWQRIRGGSAFVRRLAHGDNPRAAWMALPGSGVSHWTEMLISAAIAALGSGRGVIVLAPERHDVEMIEACLRRYGFRVFDESPGESPAPQYARLIAEDGVSVRYRSYLAVLRGEVSLVVGTRSAVFAPVAKLGLIAMWGENDDLFAERRAPYPHARQVAAMRAAQESSALLFGSHSRSTETQVLVESGWVKTLAADRATVRAHTPTVSTPSEVELGREGGGAFARFPGFAHRLVASSLESGPVLIHVPHAGYLPGLACVGCRAPARCVACSGPLSRTKSGTDRLECRWCARHYIEYACVRCGEHRLRSYRVGVERTAEELGRAFPLVRVIHSSGSHRVTRIEKSDPAIVLATPGAEPVVDQGYSVAVMMDAGAESGRPQMRAGEEALSRWFAVAALVRSTGRVLVLGDPPPMLAQALIRWDPEGYASRELAEREQLRLPPAVRAATVSGNVEVVGRFLRRLELPQDAEVIGPISEAGGPNGDISRAIVRIPLATGAELSAALKAALTARSLRKEPGSVNVRIDPLALP